MADEWGGLASTEEDVLAATERFSRWKLQDLVKEYLVNHPFLRSLFPLFANSGYAVTRELIDTRFEARREALHEEFPANTDSLTPQGITDVLQGVGFPGVWRGDDVVHTGGIHAPPGPGKDEFHVHPCCRPALDSGDNRDVGMSHADGYPETGRDAREGDMTTQVRPARPAHAGVAGACTAGHSRLSSATGSVSAVTGYATRRDRA